MIWISLQTNSKTITHRIAYKPRNQSTEARWARIGGAEGRSEAAQEIALVRGFRGIVSCLTAGRLVQCVKTLKDAQRLPNRHK